MERCLGHHGDAHSVYLEQLLLSLGRENLLLGLWRLDLSGRCSFGLGALGMQIIIHLGLLVGTAFATHSDSLVNWGNATITRHDGETETVQQLSLSS